MPACSTFPVFPNKRPPGIFIFGKKEWRARGEEALFYPWPIQAALAEMSPNQKICGTLLWSQGLGSGSVGGWREALVGVGLTWGTFPKAHGVAGPPLESRLQGLVGLPLGCGEARILCIHLHRQEGAGEVVASD